MAIGFVTIELMTVGLDDNDFNLANETIGCKLMADSLNDFEGYGKDDLEKEFEIDEDKADKLYDLIQEIHTAIYDEIGNGNDGCLEIELMVH
jgi:hypothetical protein